MTVSNLLNWFVDYKSLLGGVSLSLGLSRARRTGNGLPIRGKYQSLLDHIDQINVKQMVQWSPSIAYNKATQYTLCSVNCELPLMIKLSYGWSNVVWTMLPKNSIKPTPEYRIPVRAVLK